MVHVDGNDTADAGRGKKGKKQKMKDAEDGNDNEKEDKTRVKRIQFYLPHYLLQYKCNATKAVVDETHKKSTLNVRKELMLEDADDPFLNGLKSPCFLKFSLKVPHLNICRKLSRNYMNI